MLLPLITNLPKPIRLTRAVGRFRTTGRRVAATFVGWVLYTGIWNDSKYWDDNKIWRDEE